MRFEGSFRKVIKEYSYVDIHTRKPTMNYSKIIWMSGKEGEYWGCGGIVLCHCPYNAISNLIKQSSSHACIFFLNEYILISQFLLCTNYNTFMICKVFRQKHLYEVPGSYKTSKKHPQKFKKKKSSNFYYVFNLYLIS